MDDGGCVMTREEIGAMFAYIKQFHPNFEITKSKAAAWQDIFQGFDSKLVLAAVKDHLRESKWVPVPAEVIDRIRSQERWGKPSGETLWAQIMHCAQRSMSHTGAIRHVCEPYRNKPAIGKPIMHAMKALDWYKCQYGDIHKDIPFIKHAFIKSYEHYEGEEKHQKTLTHQQAQSALKALEQSAGGKLIAVK